ncbi:MAG: aminotransferase class I/II-fold pyridoxal phosphate-dependent enzyme, partial [Rhodospirillaceae bacterium]
LDRLNNCPGLSCLSPDGAFYVYPDCSSLIGRKTEAGKTLETDRDVVLCLMEDHGVGAVQGEAFGLSPHWTRFSSPSTGSSIRWCRARKVPASGCRWRSR